MVVVVVEVVVVEVEVVNRMQMSADLSTHTHTHKVVTYTTVQGIVVTVQNGTLGPNRWLQCVLVWMWR